MNFDLKRLYELLPSLYRIRDTELGIRMLTPGEKSALERSGENLDDHVHGPLKSLLSILADQIAVLEENLEQLYDDQFIETCAEWAVSYIGQLVGAKGLISIPDAPFSHRGSVANTIRYRRRKGTACVVEQLARDVTGWNSNVVEYFQRLATTQYMNHLRPKNLSISGLRNWELLEYANTPFDRMAHTADVRRIEKRRGRYNIPNIGIFLWRLNSYTLEKAPAYKVDDRRYTFDALGKSRPLYNHPQTETEIIQLAEPTNVPMPIHRRVLSHYLETYYGKDKSILLYVNGQAVGEGPVLSPPAPPLRDLLSVCDLSDVTDAAGNTVWAHMPEHKIAIDPMLGRIAFPASDPPPDKVQVEFYYAFGSQIGGGGYGRESTFTQNKGPTIIVNAGTHSIQDALDQLQHTGGAVEIKNNEYYFEDLVIRVAKEKTIELRSADKTRPVLVPNTGIRIEAEENCSVIINGLLISGGTILCDPSSKLKLLRLVHCTLVPGPRPAIGPAPAGPATPCLILNAPDTAVEIEKSIVGVLQIFDGARVSVNNSIVDAVDESAMAYAGLSDQEPGGTLRIQNTTVFGRVHTRILELASNCIFIAPEAASPAMPVPVKAQRLQQGCVRFSYLPPGSRIPRPYRCQPASAVDFDNMRPMFTSRQYGDPGYGQLSVYCAPEIAQGADDEAEMGAFHHLYQPQRVANLKTRLDEYLRFGLEAGIFFAS